MSKIILWSRCSGDAASAKCNVKVDSYKSCSMFKGREYSLVRIWWRLNCKLTNGRRPSKETLCISSLLYFLEPWLRCLLLVLSNRFKTFTDWHPGLVRFPMLSMWSLQPYGAAVPCCLIQYSSHFRRKGVLKPGLFVGWYIFSRIRTFIKRTEWSGRLKCLYNNWLPPVLIEDRCPFILFLKYPLVSPTYINPQRAHSDNVHYVIWFTRQILETMCGKWTFGEITWKRIVGNKNITCFTILGPAFRDSAVIRDKTYYL